MENKLGFSEFWLAVLNDRFSFGFWEKWLFSMENYVAKLTLKLSKLIRFSNAE